MHQAVHGYCNRIGRRTFSLQLFFAAYRDLFQKAHPHNKHVYEKIRQQLQGLRDTGIPSFDDNRGRSTLRSVPLLQPEREELQTIDVTAEQPERREYLVEIYVRKVGWARLAVERFGDRCMYDRCDNTFRRPDGPRYVEVHHIVPLCDGGTDALGNRSVLCAHHHTMAHYAEAPVRREVRRLFPAKVERMLGDPGVRDTAGIPQP